jgi:sugar/nucleoside kinase (ribokinase family)
VKFKLEPGAQINTVDPMRVSSKRRRSAHLKTNRSVSVGSGFVALDLVLIGNEQRTASFTFAGGSCGNVLAILAYFGWDAVPVIRLKDDGQAAKLLNDLQKWSVNTRFIMKEPKGITPVVVQRICTAINGDAYHRFEWKCPTTGVWLPRYRPLPQRMAIEVSTKMPVPKVFYFDRVAKSALILAQKSRDSGALVFFEPSSIGDPDLFRQCVAVCDILKYSAERLPQPPTRAHGAMRLEIQTLGKEGLRYRWFRMTNRVYGWVRLDAIPAADFKDAAGAGDWCSAGIIQSIGHSGSRGFARAGEQRIIRAMRFGQSLAAINCRYEGARGAMYQMPSESLVAEAASLLDSKPTAC